MRHALRSDWVWGEDEEPYCLIALEGHAMRMGHVLDVDEGHRDGWDDGPCPGEQVWHPVHARRWP